MYICPHYECRCNDKAVCYRRPEPVFFHLEREYQKRLITINRCLSLDTGRRPETKRTRRNPEDQ